MNRIDRSITSGTYDKKWIRIMDEKDFENLDLLELHYLQLEELDTATLIEIIKSQRKLTDSLQNIQRSPYGEMIIQEEEEVIKDEDEYL
ncbi:MAG: hypothetical protein KGZ34_06540 [Nitrosarchaeum sp.]|nr:hypothetical protein [Nitrosarchaeum sp.]MCE9651918.1 hypothetical protein [Nitrosarchaeum sp.]